MSSPARPWGTTDLRDRSSEKAVPMKLHVSLGLAAAFMLACLVALCSSPATRACTSFLMGNQASPAPHVVAKSYDWDHGAGVVVTNKRDVRKTAMQLLATGEKALSWTSRFSSVTFNQYGREMPNGGMNERGLVVEILWLTETRYASPDSRPELNELQWIQYQLDNFSSVGEMVASAPFIRIAPLYAKVHYFACDAKADCATFEWLDGKLEIHVGASLPAAVLANDTYASSIRFAAPYLSRRTGPPSLPSGSESDARFTRATVASKRLSPTASEAVNDAFKHLDNVAQGAFTKWQIVYEPTSLRVHFRARPAWKTHVVDVGALVGGTAGSCKAPALQLTLQSAQGGEATKRFEPWSSEDNRRLVQESFRALGAGALLLKPVVAHIANYPETTRCAQK